MQELLEYNGETFWDSFLLYDFQQHLRKLKDDR